MKCVGVGFLLFTTTVFSQIAAASQSLTTDFSQNALYDQPPSTILQESQKSQKQNSIFSSKRSTSSANTEPVMESNNSPLIDFITEFQSVVSGSIDSSSVVSNLEDMLTTSKTAATSTSYSSADKRADSTIPYSTVGIIHDGSTSSHTNSDATAGSFGMSHITADTRPPSSTTPFTTSKTTVASSSTPNSFGSTHNSASDFSSGNSADATNIEKTVQQSTTSSTVPSRETILLQMATKTSSINTEPEHVLETNRDEGKQTTSSEILNYLIISNALSNSTDIPTYEIDILELEIDNLINEVNSDVFNQGPEIPLEPNYEAYWPGLLQNENTEGYEQRPSYLEQPPYNTLPFKIPYDKEPYLPTKSPQEEGGGEGVIIYMPPGAFLPNIYLGRPLPYNYNSDYYQQPSTVSAPGGYPILSAALFWSKNLSNWMVKVTGVAVILLTIYRVTMRLLGYESSSRRRRAVPTYNESHEEAAALFFKALNSQQFE